MTTLEWLWIPFWPLIGAAGAVFLALFLAWLGVLWVLTNGWPSRRTAAERWCTAHPGCCAGTRPIISSTVDPDGVGEIYCPACGNVLALVTERGRVLPL